MTKKLKNEHGDRIEDPVSDPFIAYAEEWDSYYDTRTGEWIEPICDDEDCRYCIGRPPKFPLP